MTKSSSLSGIALLAAAGIAASVTAQPRPAGGGTTTYWMSGATGDSY